jgi:hypothetical protein
MAIYFILQALGAHSDTAFHGALDGRLVPG